MFTQVCFPDIARNVGHALAKLLMHMLKGRPALAVMYFSPPIYNSRRFTA